MYFWAKVVGKPWHLFDYKHYPRPNFRTMVCGATIWATPYSYVKTPSWRALVCEACTLTKTMMELGE